MKSATLNIKGINFPTLLAISEDEQRTGLMHRKDLPASMSFVYDYPKVNKFWMHNTPKALDIVFCLNGKIVSVAKGEPFSTMLIGPECVTDLVVEFPYGTCQKLQIKEGDEVEIPKIKKNFLLQNKYY
jgi:uncharacterized membrane protein (UPF0127 family)